MAFPEEVLAEGEQTLFVTSPHAIEMVSPLGWFVVVLACGGGLARAADTSDTGILIVAMTAVTGGGVVLLWLLRMLHWRYTLYAITDHRVIQREGVLSRDNRDVPLSVIQDVRVRQGLIARMAGAGHLELQSAAVRGHAVLRWVPQVQEVRRLVHHLAQNVPRPEEPPAAAGLPRFGSEVLNPQPTAVPDLVAQLHRLSELHTSRHLTDEEFNAAKKQLLGVREEPGDVES